MRSANASDQLDEMIGEAARAHAAGQIDEAERLARNVLRSRPGDAEAMLILGIVGVKKNDPGLAVPFLQNVLALDPESFDAPFWLSMIMRKHGRMQEARDMARRAVAANNRSEHALNQLGMCLLDLNESEEAVACFHMACSIDTKVGPFFDNLGRALQAAGQNGDAIAAYRQALALGPVRSAVLYRLGEAYMIDNQMEAAAECGRVILRMEPDSIQGNLMLASAFIGAGNVEKGAEFAKRAMELSPTSAMPVAYYGRALQSLGRLEEAEEQFKRSIELEPKQGFAYHALVHNHKVTEQERPVVSQMQELVGGATLPKRELIQLQYGLGKALEDLGEYGSAMSHFDEANRIDHELKIGMVPFQRSQLEETAEFLVGTFNPVFFERYKTAARDSDLPIFVVGMMRSGTTLAEQILSSHAQIGGVGEQLFWPEHAGSSQRLFRQEQTLVFDSTRLRMLSDEYLAVLDQLCPGKMRVVDKMNTNYLLLGLLHIAFPNARIVHMHRHPVDTCLSIWATPVANGVDLCASKENVVFMYQQYLRIMEHWRQVLPQDRFLDVRYEDLVADPEPHTRRLIEFCGLDWDDACLKPEKNKRSVKTPSVWQVRQPVYKTSVERWRKYEPWLGAFAELF